MMEHCLKCPRNCQKTTPFCNAYSSFPEAASVYAHKGEEPVISGTRGISNIFFAHCNLHCLFCQNHLISRREVESTRINLHSISEIVEATVQRLQETENIVGFVSATQYSDLIPTIVEGLHDKGLFPTTVYNTNGYERVEVLQQLAPYIDIYLPDFKYSDRHLAQRYSHAPNYPEIAGRALKEMYNQKGSALPTDDSGIAFRGLIVRHLVLPGQTQNSIDCLRWIADNISTNIHISLMAQYYPPDGLVLPDQLNRRLTEEEYQTVVDEFNRLGFHKGWVQQLDSADSYKPHFENNTTFET